MIRLILNTQMKSACSQLALFFPLRSFFPSPLFCSLSALLFPIRAFFPYPLFFPPPTHIALIPIVCKYKKFLQNQLLVLLIKVRLKRVVVSQHFQSSFWLIIQSSKSLDTTDSSIKSTKKLPLETPGASVIFVNQDADAKVDIRKSSDILYSYYKM